MVLKISVISTPRSDFFVVACVSRFPDVLKTTSQFHAYFFLDVIMQIYGFEKIDCVR